MKMSDITSNDIDRIMGSFRSFFKICMDELGLKSLPKITWDTNMEDNPNSFGSFNNEDHSIHVYIKNRHPNDIMRTLAHELVHYKQELEGRIKPGAGATGSPIENEANAVAGIIMRKFNHTNPNAFKISRLDESLKRAQNKV